MGSLFDQPAAARVKLLPNRYEIILPDPEFDLAVLGAAFLGFQIQLVTVRPVKNFIPGDLGRIILREIGAIHQILIGKVTVHHGLFHHAACNPDGLFHLGKIHPHFIHVAQGKEAGSLIRRGRKVINQGPGLSGAVFFYVNHHLAAFLSSLGVHGGHYRIHDGRLGVKHPVHLT